MADVKFVVLLRHPALRAYSAMFHNSNTSQLADFEAVVGREMVILDACYNQGFNLSRGCVPAVQQYRQFRRCLQAWQERTGDTDPWFSRSMDNLDIGGLGDFLDVERIPGIRAVDRSKVLPEDDDHIPAPVRRKWHSDLATRQRIRWYEGLLLRGAYADQLRNFICEGFKPRQFLLVTLGELSANLTSVVERIAEFALEGADAQPKRDTLMQGLRALEAMPHVNLNHKSQGQMPSSVYERLHAFFAPYNADLMQFLRDVPGLHLSSLSAFHHEHGTNDDAL
mgnify:CR=1 FL=1